MKGEMLRKWLPLPVRRAAYRMGVAHADSLLTVEDEGRVAGALVTLPPWNVESVFVEGDDLVARGWLLRLAGSDPLDLRINGRSFRRISMQEPRPDIRALYSHISPHVDCGFTCAIPLAELGGSNEITIDVCGTVGRTLSPSHVFNTRLVHEPTPLPEPERMRRVHGDTRPEAFLNAGYNVFRRLRDAAERCNPHMFDKPVRMLDWGCGCARIARHFAAVPGVSVTGVDIDADNVAWCASHLPFGKWMTVPLRPPTGLEETFDLIIGVSVFTHLKEAEQRAWLAELHRLAAPGGLVLASVHADAAVARERHWPLPIFLHWQRAGYVDGPSHDLDGCISEADYYRTTYHHRDYIRRVWKEWFDIVEIVPTLIGNLQDLVVLRNR
jgi:2-polyprenyl-3-methyl-5-hydroxy-6-metoxy-1,4-benzoquinol methylase